MKFIIRAQNPRHFVRAVTTERRGAPATSPEYVSCLAVGFFPKASYGRDRIFRFPIINENITSYPEILKKTSKAF